jgi:glutamate-1-semialdehyde 2,1-aminomutase
MLPASGATHVARILAPFRPYITHALGSRKWDVDGNEYIDYVIGHGTLILGHSHPAIVRAVQEQIAKGTLYGEGHALEVEWAELIRTMMPVAERVEFCACGQEANLMAIRLARIFTGRSRILRFEDNFHGWIDEVAPEGSAGAVTPEVTVVPMNDLGRVEAELATGEYAIIITEGGGAHMAGQVPWDAGFIRALPALTKKHGTLWLIDEVVTGFRDSRGGWQEAMSVKPDLTSLAKCIGGGLPAGAVAGRADVFRAFDPASPPERQMKHSGTWNSNPLSSSAGVAACKLYLDGEPQKRANQLGARLRDRGNRVLKQRGISGHLYGRTIIHLYLGQFDGAPTELTPPTIEVKKILDPALVPVRQQLCLHLLQRGVATMGGRFFVLSAAHTEEDVDQTIEALVASLEAMRADGALPG